MSDVEITAVPPEHTFAIWPKVRPYMAASAEYTDGRFDAEDVLELLATDQQTLWVAFRDNDILGGVTTNFLHYPRMDVLCVHFCGGEHLDEWSDKMFETLRGWAKDNKCERIESTGRSGWARVFKSKGHKPLWYTFDYPVAGGDDGQGE